MEIVKFENQNLNLVPKDQEIFKANHTRFLSELTPNERFKLLQGEWIKCQAKLGYKPKDEAEIMFETQMLFEEVGSYKWMREDHVKIIFARAVKGDWNEGEKVFYSIASFNQWAKKFYNESQRVEAIAIEALRKEEVKPVPTDDELKLQCIETINDYVKIVLDSRKKGTEYQFPFGGLHHLFNIAQKFGIINLTKEEKLSLLDEINPKLPQDARIQMAKGQAYKNFILELADLDVLLDQFGKPEII